MSGTDNAQQPAITGGPQGELVRYETSGQVANIVLNRPEKLNAFNDAMTAQLAGCLARFERDPKAAVAVLSGNGRAFSAGVDVSQEHGRGEDEMRRLRDPMSPGTPFGDLLLRSESWKPVIASVHGYALGMALGLVLKCDLIVAEAGTRFQVTETSRGLGGYRHWALLSYRRAGALGDEVCLTGRFFTAEECQAAGLLARLAPAGKGLETAMELACQIAEHPPLSIGETVRVQRWHLRHFIEEVAFQTEALNLHLTEDFKEATRAFGEKRKPGPFKGR
jgi:enoyl-CoA hydratase/carnithine racemase